MKSDRRKADHTRVQRRELVITMDRRLLYVVGLLAAFALAAAAGVSYTGRGGNPTEAQTDVNAPPGPASGEQTGGPVAAQLDEEAARATAVAEGLPTSVVIIPPIDVVTATLPAPLLTSEMGSAAATAAAAGQLYEFEVPQDRKVDASKWKHTTLANFPDPNVLAEETTPIRLEEARTTYDGPRIAISDLNHLYTYDYGEVPIDRPASHDFKVANVGNADLVISRIYSGCGCTATQVGGQTIDPAGWLPQRLVLKPGQSEVFTITFDPQFDKVLMSQAKYVQVFSNDPTRAIFDASDPYSHEVRFRIVVETVQKGTD